ncbi:adenine deaminase [Paenibacillus sacheonensis]|nr:adenine deaminase [Paenibacillus sacheonensis]
MVAGKQIPADLVVKGAKIVNVFTGALMDGDVAIADGVIAGIGSYEGIETIDAESRYIVPGFMDGHVHIESSMLAPREFAKVLLRHGVTTVVTDPHEIVNVAGTDGLDYMLSSAEGLPLDIFVMLPSCVPVTPFESNGAVLEAERMAPYYAHPQVLGLAEVMNYPAVASAEASMLGKLAGAQAKRIDGHAAGIDRERLNVYPAAGIVTDHESVSADEARNRLDLGMYLMIREGTVAKNLEALLPVVTERNARRCLFVTDDKLLGDLIDEGSIDHVVRLAIRQGLDPITAIQMATINTAECFELRGRGAIAPGYRADFLLLDDLERVGIHAVYVQGECVVRQGMIQEKAFPEEPARKHLADTLPMLNVKPVQPGDLALPLTSDSCNVIEIIPNQIVTRHLKESVGRHNGVFRPSIAKDQLKLAVVERHRGTGNIGLGIVKGLGLRKGAIASTVSHDSHNIVIAGTSDEDMLAALEHLVEIQGGLVVVKGGKVAASLPLPVAGLMSEREYGEVYANCRRLNEALAEIGAPKDFDPFLTLSFLTLPVIPALKLTDLGLFDFEAFRLVPVEA